jgi:hypothetical protein
MNKGFTQIPNRVIWSGKKLTDEEFRLYCALQSHKFHKEVVFPGREKLAKEMGASVAKVDRVKKHLELKGAFRKKRRGQGETNLYFLDDNFLLEADNSPVSCLGDSPVSGKEEKENNTNNYLKTSQPGKRTEVGGNPQPYPEPQPHTNPPTDVIFRAHLKSLKALIDTQFSKLISENAFQEYGYSTDTAACINGILYYVHKYYVATGIEHPLYKKTQLYDCMLGFLNGILEIEKANLPTEETLIKVVDRWFGTTTPDSNNLRLSHFVGNRSSIFLKCLDAVVTGNQNGGYVYTDIV